jgi:hypothetical protein
VVALPAKVLLHLAMVVVLVAVWVGKTTSQ